MRISSIFMVRLIIGLMTGSVLAEPILISEDVLPRIKRSLTVRLDEPISEQRLRALAHEFKASSKRSYQRTFIAYYLPGMDLDSGAWATTNFNPNLKITIHGLSIEKEKKLKSIKNPQDWDVVGRWLDPGNLYFQHRITIFRKDNSVFMDQTFSDGSSGQSELIETKSPVWRLDPVEESFAGDYWILNPNGQLEAHDNDGFITAVKPMR